jgi:hypothetical protein
MRAILLLLFLFSCASKQDLPSLRKDTQTILNKFDLYHQKYRNKPAPKIYIGMVPGVELRETRTIATCRYTPRPHIVIKKELWEETSFEEKEYILFHELGHCLLNRRHENDAEGGKPLSLMNQAFTNHHLDFYLDNKRFYIEELFSAY